MRVRIWLAIVLLVVATQARAAADMAIGCLPGSAGMTLAEVRSLPDTAWRPADPSEPFKGLAKAEWCRLRVAGPDALGKVVRFKVTSVVIAPVARFYWPDAAADSPGVEVSVETQSFGHSRYPAVLVEARYLDRPIHLRFPNRESPRGSLEAWGVSDYIARVRMEQSFQMAVLASMAVLGLMAILFAYQLDRKVLGYLCLWVVAVIVLRLLESGLVTEWMSMGDDTRRVVNAVSLTVTIVASIIFGHRYLGLGTHFPRISKLLMVLAGCFIVLGMMVMHEMTEPVRDAYNLMVILQFLIIAGCALVLFARGDEMARFFTLGWLPLLIISIVRIWYFVVNAPMPGWMDPLWQLTLLFAMFVLLLVTARATRDTEREMHVVRRAASHDPLTGLPNRAFLFNALRSGIDKARANDAPFSLLFLDLDHFKRINDLYGHEVGDRCLAHFAVTMQARLRGGDTLARMGGEEFVALLPGATVEHAGKVSDALRQALADAPLVMGDSVCPMTVSIGVAGLRVWDDAESLLRRADAALYRAKADGRDRTVLETSLTAA